MEISNLKNHQSELKKLLEMDKQKEIKQQFIIDYMNGNMPEKQVAEHSKQFYKRINNINELLKDKLVTRLNWFQLMIVIKYKIIQNKCNCMQLLQFIDKIIVQLLQNQKYLLKSYFQNPQEIKNKNILLGVQCPICIKEIPMSDACFLSCGHAFHLQCFTTFARMQIQNKLIPLQCPNENCQPVHIKDIEQYLIGELRDKFYQFSFHKYIQKNYKDTTWCPTPGCKGVFAFDEGLKMYNCPSCKKQYCISCRCEMHHGMSCQEYINSKDLNETDQVFVKFAHNSKFKQCPQCKFWVQKSQGCDHMTCRCEYQFCYKCGQQYGICDCDEDISDDRSYNEDDDQSY